MEQRFSLCQEAIKDELTQAQARGFGRASGLVGAEIRCVSSPFSTRIPVSPDLLIRWSLVQVQYGLPKRFKHFGSASAGPLALLGVGIGALDPDLRVTSPDRLLSN